MDVERYRRNAKTLGCLLMLGAIVVIPVMLGAGTGSSGPVFTPAKQLQRERRVEANMSTFRVSSGKHASSHCATYNSKTDMRKAMTDELIIEDIEPEVLAGIRSNAAMVVSSQAEQFSNHLKYDEASVKWLDGYIERARRSEVSSRVVNTLGSFFGECVTRTYGGRWVRANGVPAIQFESGNVFFPFDKTLKHLEHGAVDSVLGCFQFMPRVLNLRQSEQGPTDCERL